MIARKPVPDTMEAPRPGGAVARIALSNSDFARWRGELLDPREFAQAIVRLASD